MSSVTVWIYIFLLFTKGNISHSATQYRCQSLERRLHVNLTGYEVYLLSNDIAKAYPVCLRNCALNGKCLSFLWTGDICIYLKWFLLGDPDNVIRDWLYYEKPVLKNVAFGKDAEQSSTYYSHVAANAVDGNLINTACTHFDDARPWWKVDLKDTYWITEVRFLPYRGIKVQYSPRLRNITIDVFNSAGKWHNTCGLYRGPPSIKNWVSVTCVFNTKGRFVMLWKYDNDYPELELSETEISGVVSS